MNGTAHATIGAGIGFAIAQFTQADPVTTLSLIGMGVVTGLLPDLDIDGKLSKKITLSHKLIRQVAQLIGLMMMIYALLEGTGTQRYIAIGIGVTMMVISSFIKQRHMLTITGLGVLAGGISLNENWLLLLGIYIIIASFTAHRSYTHSIIGVIYFSFIAHAFEESIKIEGTYLTCLLAYISHLIADMKFLPFNRRGIKLFLPFSSREI